MTAQPIEFTSQIQAAFPVRLDMSKTSSRKQEDDESVCNYLTGLTEVHNTHSSLTPPADLKNNAVTAWEAHLRNSFLNGLKPDISNMVKHICITWDSWKHMLCTLRRSSKKARRGQEKRKRKISTRLHRLCSKDTPEGADTAAAEVDLEGAVEDHAPLIQMLVLTVAREEKSNLQAQGRWTRGGGPGGGGTGTFDHTDAR